MNTQEHLGIGSSGAGSAKPTILIAEDSDDGREMMEALLHLKGYDVISAESGRQAIEVATSRHPDLILLDLGLPDIDGLGVIRNLRRRPGLKEVPMLILSGHDPAQYRQQAIEVGCTKCLVKPIDFDELERILRRSMRKSAPQSSSAQTASSR